MHDKQVEPLFAAVQSVNESRALTAEDDFLHPVASDNLYWTETSWWSLNIPERSIGLWIYMVFRPNLGISSQGIWLWDDTGPSPWTLPYLRQNYHLPMPSSTRPIVMGAGLEWEVLKPLVQHVIRLDDSPQLRFELEFTAVAPPHPVGVGETTGHLDQALWVTGELNLGKQTLQVDSSAFRDRTWSVREDAVGVGRRSFYCFGVGRDFAFHVFVIYDESGSQHWLENGFVYESGKMTEVKRISRRVVSRSQGKPSRVVLDFVDAAGRNWHAWGQAASGAWAQSWPGFYAWATTVPWHVNDMVLWGEDHDTWTQEHFAAERDTIADIDEFAQRLDLS